MQGCFLILGASVLDASVDRPEGIATVLLPSIDENRSLVHGSMPGVVNACEKACIGGHLLVFLILGANVLDASIGAGEFLILRIKEAVDRPFVAGIH